MKQSQSLYMNMGHELHQSTRLPRRPSLEEREGRTPRKDRLGFSFVAPVELLSIPTDSTHRIDFSTGQLAGQDVSIFL
jgi:hypothetical protein